MSQKGISGTRRPGLNNEAIHGILGATGDQRHWDALSDQVPWCHIKKKNFKIAVPESALEGTFWWYLLEGYFLGTFWGLSESHTSSIILYTHFELYYFMTVF